MTEKEKTLMEKLVEVHNLFTSLEVYHEADSKEWVHNLHALQNIVMSREAVRNNPTIFLNQCI